MAKIPNNHAIRQILISKIILLGANQSFGSLAIQQFQTEAS